LTPGNPLPAAAGLAVTADGKTIVVANYENDSVSLVNTMTRKTSAELDLRPGKNDPLKAGVPGGEFPYWVAVKRNDIAYVSSVRDREIVVVNLQETSSSIVKRIPVTGNPNRMVLDMAQTKLYVALDNSDEVGVIDTRLNSVIDSVKTAAPEGFLASTRPGASPNSLAFSPDGRTLYVTNGATNSVAVVAICQGSPAGCRSHPDGLVSELGQRQLRWQDALCREQQKQHRTQSEALPPDRPQHREFRPDRLSTRLSERVRQSLYVAIGQSWVVDPAGSKAVPT
jgi:YVTN family beta-propeller protein